MMINKNLEGLIDCSQWHVLHQKHAIENIASKKTKSQVFAQSVLEFIASYFKPTQSIHIALACGDEARFLDVLQLIQYASQWSWAIDVYIPPKLAKSWEKWFAKEEIVFPVVFSDEIPLHQHYFCIIDCVAPLDVSPLSDEHQKLMQSMQAHPAMNIALDIPSGLNPNTGGARGEVLVHAQICLCRYAYFKGLYTGVAQEYVGASALLMPSWPVVLDFHDYLLTPDYLMSLWPHRKAYVSKSAFQRVKVIAGQKSMFGASILAAYAALVMGAGWVEVLYQEGLVPPYGQIPEVIWQPIAKASDILKHIEETDILVIGPGLGFKKWADDIWSLVENLPNSMVVDASALKYLAAVPVKRKNWVITPHPGEAATLLGWSVEAVQIDRFKAIKALQNKFGCTCVLKGSGSLITADGQTVFLCADGNPGMATPGMGDVLSGLIAGSLAQMTDHLTASLFAVGLHARAGDSVIQRHPAMIVRPMKLIQELQNHMQDVLCK